MGTGNENIQPGPQEKNHNKTRHDQTNFKPKIEKREQEIRLFLPERGHLTTRTCTNKTNMAKKHSLVARVSRTLVPCG